MTTTTRLNSSFYLLLVLLGLQSAQGFVGTFATTTSAVPTARSTTTELNMAFHRRDVFSKIKRTLVGVAAIGTSSGRASSSSAATSTNSKLAPSDTAGRIVQVTVDNLDGVAGNTGTFHIQLRPEWAPLGVARMEELVQTAFFDDNRIFRVLPGRIAQFGIHGTPRTHAHWRSVTIPDDPPLSKWTTRRGVSNQRGTVVFAKHGPTDGRTSQLFINMGDNAYLDQQGFVPIGHVLGTGMEDVVDRFYAGYHPDNGNQPIPGLIETRGNAYLRKGFPKLSYISGVKFLDGAQSGALDV